MADLNSVIHQLSNLDAAIEDALKNEVAEAARSALQDAAYAEVYDAYDPEFRSRRMENGGIADVNNMTVEVIGNTLTVSDDAPWQQLWGGKVPDGRLAEAIASGDKKYNMHKAGPRPFHEAAKEALIDQGKADEALRRGLARQGIDTSEMTFAWEWDGGD